MRNGNTLSSFFASGAATIGNTALAAAMEQHQKNNDALMTNFMVEQLDNLQAVGPAAKKRMKELNDAAKTQRLNLRKLVVATALLRRNNEAHSIVAVVAAQYRLTCGSSYNEESIRQRVKRDLTHRLNLSDEAIDIKDNDLFDPQVTLTAEEEAEVNQILGSGE